MIDDKQSFVFGEKTIVFLESLRHSPTPPPLLLTRSHRGSQLLGRRRNEGARESHIAALIAGCLALFALLYLPDPGLCDVPNQKPITLFDVGRTFKADGSRGPYRISERPILNASESVWVAGRLQRRGQDYLIEKDRALLRFFEDLVRGTPVTVRFRQLPQVLRQVYRRRQGTERAIERERSVRRTQRIKYNPGRTVRSQASVGEPMLEIGGSKRIQVAMGSNRGPELHQSLRVQVSGEVAEGVELLAMLSDQDLPLQSGGRTRSLQEIDRIHFQVRSRSINAGLGDQDVVFNETTFGRYRRQLQGASLGFSLPYGTVKAFGAVSRGRWVSRRIAPVEGYQGPYRLSGGAEGGGTTEIVPGSERVYLNGRQLKRGEGQDYVMDYERGLLTFTPFRPISAESRITVEYQYLHGGHRRRLIGLRGEADLSEGRVQIGTTFIRESDQPGIPIPASEGDPGTASRHQVTVLDASYAPFQGLTLNGEVGLSLGSADAFQPGAQDQCGRAFRFGADLASGPLRLSGLEVGRVRLRTHYRQIGSEFSTFDRIDLVDIEGKWGWIPEQERQGERSGEMALEYLPRTGIRMNVGYGRKDGIHPASRRELGFNLSRPDATKVGYRFEAISRGGGKQVRQYGDVSGEIWGVRPGFRFQSETALGDAAAYASVFYASPIGNIHTPEGVKTRELGWTLSKSDARRWSWTTDLGIKETRRLQGAWQDSLKSWSLVNRGDLKDWKGLSFSGAYSRTRFLASSSSGQDADLASVRLSYTPLGGALSQQFTYRISSAGAPRRESVFVFVGEGKGTFVWEDVDGDGEEDREEFVPDTHGDFDPYYGFEGGFQPVREAALGLRFEVAGHRLLRSPEAQWQRLLSEISVDLSMEAARKVFPGESGVAPWDLSGFRTGPEIFSAGRERRARLHLFRYNRRASFRITSRRRSGLDRNLSADGQTHLSELAARGRFRFGAGFDLESDLSSGRRGREGEGPFAYGIESNTFSLFGRWRIDRGWHTGLRFGMGWDQEELRALKARRLSVGPELQRAFLGRGRIRGSMDWVRVTSTGQMPLFLRLAEGNREGQNVVWRLGLDYRLARYLTAFATYDGRVRPERPVIHTGRMEMRATF